MFLRLLARYERRGKRFIYLDESGFAACASRPFAYAPIGLRTYGFVDAHTRPRTSLLAARVGGTHKGLIAPMLFEGSCNADTFNTWLTTQLAKELTSNDVVIMDNAAFHKTPQTRAIIEATGATLLYLPPYSPDLNPIEHDFAAIKKIGLMDKSVWLDLELYRQL